VAATLYGIGNRLDHQPELLFKLRQVDHLELITQAASPITKPMLSKKKTIAVNQLAEVFGIELESPVANKGAGTTAKSVRRPNIAMARTAAVPKKRMRR
jgi:uncharacterized Zn finger protein